MRFSLRTRRAKLIGAAGSFAAVPAIALATALLPCDCPLHVGGGSAAHADHTHAAPAQLRGAATADTRSEHAGHHGETTGPRPANALPEGSAGWEVGTASSPLVTRPQRGALWASSSTNGAGRMDHGTPEERYVARKLTERRLAGVTDPQQRIRLRMGLAAVAPSAEPVATRAAVLTTKQATAKLSRKCRKLVAVKRPSKLSKADKKRRTACLAQRKKLIADSKKKAKTPVSTSTSTPAPSSSPAAPTPTPAPGAPVPTALPTVVPTPTPTPRACPHNAALSPCVYGAVGVQAYDNSETFGLSRGTVTADIVNFQLENKDRQAHNLYIAPVNASGTITGAIKEVVGDLAGGGVSAGVDVPLAPGSYKLICIIDGHGPMTVTITVVAPKR